MFRTVICLLLSLGAAFVGVGVILWLTHFRRAAMMCPRASVEQIAGKDVLLVFPQEHPPWAHSHVYNVSIDYQRKKVDVVEMFVVWRPFAERILQKSPVLVTTDGVPPGRYTVRYWDGKQPQVFGELLLEKSAGDKREQMSFSLSSGQTTKSIRPE